MDPRDMLLALAELSLALAGFSGIVVGLHARSDRALSRQDRFGLVHILVSSVSTLTFSLLPFALHAAGWSEETAWTSTGVALGVTTLLGAAFWTNAARTTRPRIPLIFWLFVGSGYALGAALLATETGVFAYSGTLVPLVLLWTLGVGIAQFVTFLAFAWFSQDGSAAGEDR